VLVLSADVGEACRRGPRAVRRLRALGTVDVVSCDGLSAFGAVTRHMIRDGYRWQLRWAPTYSAMYWLVTRVAPVRGGRVGAGRRRPAPPARIVAASSPTWSSRPTLR
jgi:hypothetical protein